MIDKQDLTILRDELEALRTDLLSGDLGEQDVYDVMRRASILQQRAAGTPFEPALREMLLALGSVRRNVRGQARVTPMSKSA